MTRFNNILFVITFMLLSSLGFASKFTVMTFNVENLFDNLDDPQKEDETYLPSSMKASKLHIDQCNILNLSLCSIVQREKATFCERTNLQNKEKT